MHHTEYRTRTVDAGFDRVTTDCRSESVDSTGRTVRGTSRHTVLWPRRTDVTEAQDRYTALADQATLMQKELMRLGPGYRFVRDDIVSASPEYVRRLTDPWSPSHTAAGRFGRGSGNWLADAKFVMTLDRLKGTSRYRPPHRTDALPPTIGGPPGATERLRTT